jgi:protein-L-isoaspartate(D-aspartate) O-methyltransferase
MSHFKSNRPGFPVRLDRPSAPLPLAGLRTALNPSAKSLKTEAFIPLKRSDACFSDSKFTVDQDRTALNHEALRLAMVHKLQGQGIRHEAVLRAMRDTERHRFIDTGWANQAYEDTSLPIGYEQTISKPSVVARMLELLVHNRAVPMGRVLDIGTGCGYQAVVLSRLCEEVYSIERLKTLHDKARDVLRPFRRFNVHLLLGDGMLGYAPGAPYSGIVAAAGGQFVPKAWLAQLALGGRLVAPVDMGGGRQSLIVIDHTPQGLVQQVLEPVQFVPLKSGIA